jgi:uncharacterized protein (DUF2126 family)
MRSAATRAPPGYCSLSRPFFQSPLEFEWVERASGQTLRAARYHFWNPHAPVYEGRPESAEVAGHRRAERWQVADDLVGRVPCRIEPKLSPEYQYTLDLRRQLMV